MNGKLVGMILVGLALIAGAGMYYLQVYHFYEEIDERAAALSFATAEGEERLDVTAFEAIDATSSPLRFRACVTLADPDAFAAIAAPMAEPTPLNAPGWFECFDARAVGEALEAGQAQAFLLKGNVALGVDRVLALFPDGRAYIWHQANAELES